MYRLIYSPDRTSGWLQVLFYVINRLIRLIHGNLESNVLNVLNGVFRIGTVGNDAFLIWRDKYDGKERGLTRSSGANNDFRRANG